MTDGHCFISYSNVDALKFVRQHADELEGGEDKLNRTAKINILAKDGKND